jgi:hypothetical protein
LPAKAAWIDLTVVARRAIEPDPSYKPGFSASPAYQRDTLCRIKHLCRAGFKAVLPEHLLGRLAWHLGKDRAAAWQGELGHARQVEHIKTDL